MYIKIHVQWTYNDIHILETEISYKYYINHKNQFTKYFK